MQEEENSQAQEQPQQPHQPHRGEAAGASATPAAPSTSRGTSGGSPGRNQSGASSSTQRTKNVITFFLSEYDSDPYFLQLSQNMATNCLLIFVFLPVLTRIYLL